LHLLLRPSIQYKGYMWGARLRGLLFVQEHRNIDSYKAHNVFLADINNDRDTKNPLYKKNLSTLEKFVLFRFEHDTTVVPRDSAWFGWYNGTQLLTMNQTELYKVPLLYNPWQDGFAGR